MKEATVRVKDGDLFYRFAGQGEPLILLHSLGLSSESWDRVAEQLSSRFSLYAVDIMGHGNSGKPDRNYRIYDFAENVVEFMDALGIDRAMVVGNSIGAVISIEMSVSFPQRVIKQVLVGCPAWETEWERMERLVIAAPRYNSKGEQKPMTMEALRLSFAYPNSELLEWVNGQRAKAGLWCKKAHIAITLWDVMPMLPRVACPTLVLFGSEDTLRERERVLLDGITGVKYALIEDAGHIPQMEAPEAFLKPVMEFLLQSPA